ncbi:MAG: Crp/Fnr family transcriptional regulator [Zetaproteobacteria bacterium CG12_big_fil_rev_8_21_14_0_65_55_1124]|nr:MAG: Crp/Fnr family transcriptional regulator [Zetaproteobacteria bacterium CG1_02_55_237]PIS18955.1 MAG: Crp/Fnr family transcriptional regulator [Zetaproteobacteria bacterium CG08_land_8_20_14_0_20_55_17]PIW42154.1 MAG: Crp/Fnr family transcriptional regulator [Zetaproteobacteria bacterium CG12_big_fil_rev_8_21_14_0_65_55_1124]PIY54364.1 MAG: Crp/Fnr family transcriptional regulator [Zetaproteobacteria bacterium CG_4_10_14_0_8_um_filter_55_43]PIZ38908.1 MAG: Crp/Fnr family transcriptional 
MKEIIGTVPLFSELDEIELAAISTLVSSKHVGKNSIVVQEGESGDAMAIILSGAVKVSQYASDGREVVLCLLEKGDFFGEMALLDTEPRSATVTTMEESELGFIRRKDFARLMLEMPRLTSKLLAEITHRLRRTNLVLAHISTMDVSHRLYAYLNDYCEQYGRLRPDGRIEIKLPTHQLVADQLSTSRETISRAISALTKDGVIIPLAGRGRVKVDVAALDQRIEDF